MLDSPLARGYVAPRSMRLSDLLVEERVDTSLVARDKAAALDAVARLLAHGVEPASPSDIHRVLRDREQLASTGVGDEVAIPHGKLPGLGRIVAALALAPAGVDFDSIDQRPVRIFVAILAPERSASDHLRALARVSKLLRDARIRARLVGAATPAEILQIIREEEAPLGG